MTMQTLAVLSTMLSDPEADWYGLDLCKRSGIAPGTIYPLLARLVKAGWLERTWESIDPVVEGRPRRRLYCLTALGATEGRWTLDGHLAALRPAAAAATLGLRPQPARS